MNKRRFGALLLACVLALPAFAAAGDVQYTADFEYMRYFSPNVVGWLYQPDTAIDSPVMLAQEGYYYLNHAFDGKYSAPGSVYMLGDETPDLSAADIVLRGKNDMNNRLFGSLSEYREPDYYAKHPTLYLISPEGNYQLDIFAGVKTRHKDRDSWMITDLDAVLANSFLTPDPAFLPEADDSWAILTTEDAKGEGSRFVIYARKRPMPVSDGPVIWLNQQGLDASKSVSGYATAEGAGPGRI